MIVIRPICGSTSSQPAFGCCAILSIPDNDYVVGVDDDLLLYGFDEWGT
jgi:hypothetical protein